MAAPVAAAAAVSATPWIPEDDLLLKNAVEAGASLEALAKGAVRFSRKFTVRELRDRWHSLLYDSEISAAASARMTELELSAALPNLPSRFSKSGAVASRESSELSAKRKLDSIRRLYYAMRKKACSRRFESSDFSFRENMGFHDNGNDLVFNVPQFKQDSVREGLVESGDCVAREIPDTSPFHVEGISSPLPLWKTIEDVPVPEMPLNASEEEGLVQSGDADVDNVGRVLAASNATPECDILLNFANENLMVFEDAEGKDAMDRSCFDSVNLLLVSSPNNVCGGDVVDVKETGTLVADTSLGIPGSACPSDVDATAGEFLSHDGNKPSHSCSELSAPSSTSMPNTSAAKDSDNKEMECTLNTEDPEIPSNDQFSLAKRFKPSAMATSKEAGYMSLSFANQKDCKQQLSLMKKEDNPVQSLTPSLVAGLDILPVTGLSQQHVSSIVKCESSEVKFPAVVSRQASNPHGGPSMSKSGQPTPITSSVNMLKVESLHACNAKDELEYAKASSPPNAVLLTEADSISHQEDSGSNDDEEDDVPSFSDIEAMIIDMDLCPDDSDSRVDREVSRYQHENTKRTIMRLEQCARSSMQRAIASRGALAILYGRHLKHYIKEPEVMLGRATDDMEVDIDLRREGPANKISRRQALIKMEGDGSFLLKNVGKCPIFLNGREVVTGQSMSLGSSSLIEIRDMAFVFEVNGKSVGRYLANVTRNYQGNNIKYEWAEEVVVP